MTNVGEVVLARDVLGVGGSGLALMVAAGGLGTVLGSLAARFTTAGAWRWRRAYIVGLAAMAVELLACAVLHSFWLVVLALRARRLRQRPRAGPRPAAARRRGPGIAARPPLRPAETCVSFAFAVSFVGAGALIAAAGVRPRSCSSGRRPRVGRARRRPPPAQGVARPAPARRRSATR